MTAKRRWVPNIYHEPGKVTQLNISWSSSDSDDEFKECKRLRQKKKIAPSFFKPERNEKHEQKSVLDFTIPSTSKCDDAFSTLNKSELGLEEYLFSKFDYTSNSQNLLHKEYSLEKDGNSVISTSNLTCDSPIIKIYEPEKLSPILSHKPSIKEITISPIIGKMGFLRKIKSRYKKTNTKNEVLTDHIDRSVSPDLFTSQSTQVIECDSPEFYGDYNTSTSDSSISPSISQNSDYIDSFPSQSSSQVTDGSTSSSSKDNNSILYHQPVAKRKHYKKGGLAFILHKILHLQRARVAFWQHELYTKKADFIRRDKEIIEFIIKKEWKEYGSLLLECEILNKSNINGSISSSESIENVKNLVIIIVGFSAHLNITYQVNNRYKLFPPYSMKNTLYQSENILCYYNVSKLMLCEKQVIE